MADVIPFRRRPKKEPISVLVGEDDGGLYADVDGYEIRAPHLSHLMIFVLRRIEEIWARRPDRDRG